jgi:hypothetical protein
MGLYSTVNLSGALQVSLDGINFSSNPYWLTGHTYTFITGLTDNLGGAFTSMAGNYTHDFGDGTTGTFSYAGGGKISYVYAVPEPQTWALAALGVSALLFRLRRKQRVG